MHWAFVAGGRDLDHIHRPDYSLLVANEGCTANQFVRPFSPENGVTLVWFKEIVIRFWQTSQCSVALRQQA